MKISKRQARLDFYELLVTPKMLKISNYYLKESTMVF
jgi:hypothetical protein